MVSSRISADTNVDVKTLGEQITFRSGKQAPNRIMKAPLSEKLYSWDNHDLDQRGLPNSSIINLYQAWGNGGYGMILTGNMGVDPIYAGEAGQGMVSLENVTPESREIFSQMASAMKSSGGLAIGQINHVGRLAINAYTNSKGEFHKVADVVEEPVKFTKERIENDIILRFSHAAMTLHDCGFDGMELHAAHGMIFNQFLEPSNNRDDEYGGPSIERRANLLIQTYHRIRKVVPQETGFLVGVKLNSRDFQESGIPENEVIRLCELIEETGFDFVELTGGSMESAVQEINMRASTIIREKFFLEFIEKVNKVFDKTVVYITGRWQTADAMVKAVKMGLTQGVSLGRWSCAEPDFPKKLLAGEVFSCPDAKFAPSDFGTAKQAAHFQMRQMSSKDVKPDEIADFSIPEEASAFKSRSDAYCQELEKLEGGSNSLADCITYTKVK